MLTSLVHIASFHIISSCLIPAAIPRCSLRPRSSLRKTCSRSRRGSRPSGSWRYDCQSIKNSTVYSEKTHSQSICLCRCLIQSDIVDINDIFKDLGMMIHEQGDMIGEISPASVAPKLFTEPPVFVHLRPLQQGAGAVCPCCCTKCFWGQCAWSSR